MRFNRIDEALYGRKYSSLGTKSSERTRDCGCANQSNSRNIPTSGGIEPSVAARDETKLFCVTVSCCSIGPVTIEIWRQTTCHYITSNRVSIDLYPPVSDPDIEISEDVLLAGVKGRHGEQLLLPKGKYSIRNSQIEFTPIHMRAAERKEYCYERRVEGSLFGHDYSYQIRWCVSFRSSSRMGVVEITPGLSPRDLAKLYADSNREITFNQDIQLCEDGVVDLTIKAGEYYVNDDGKIYLQNVKLI